MQGMRAALGVHDQYFVDCKILMDAREAEAKDLFKRFDLEVTKLTRNMNDMPSTCSRGLCQRRSRSSRAR